MAEALVNAEHAAIQNHNGKVKAVRLLTCTENSAQRIGEASAPVYGVRFVRRELLDNGGVVWAFRSAQPGPADGVKASGFSTIRLPTSKIGGSRLCQDTRARPRMP
jgi:hypothetical protein